MNQRPNPVASLLILVVRAYQKVLSPLLPKSCKYHPSCSQYAIDAVTQFGVARGVILAGWRVLRCNPMSYGGYDPVEKQTLFVAKAAKASRGSRSLSDLEALRPKTHGAAGKA